MNTLPGSERMVEQVARATKRLAQLRARQMLRELQLATRERSRARQAALRRQREFGRVVLEAGFDGDAYELLALLRQTHSNASMVAPSNELRPN